MKRSLSSWLWRVPVDQEVDEEIAFHIEMLTRELVGQGMDPASARSLALRRLGDLDLLKRQCVQLGRKRDREMRLTQWLDELRHDVKFAVRQLRRSPGFTLVTAATLSLGVGVNAAMFALVDAALLRPLPFREPNRLVVIWDRSGASVRGSASPQDLFDWNRRNTAFEGMAGFISGVGTMVMTGANGAAESVPRQWVTAGIFRVLGILPVAGRTFLPEDETPQSAAVVLSEGFWRARFGANPDVIGRDIRLDGSPFTVVGVVPREADLIGRASIWALLPSSGPAGMRGLRYLQVVGRLRPGVTADVATAEMTTVTDAMAREFPDTNQGHGVMLEPIHDVLVGRELRLTSVLFLGVVALVLLICCANVATLLLSRASVRSRELAVRSALGAGRARVVRQLVTESFVLAALGGVLGVGVGAALLDLAPLTIPADLLPASVTPRLDVRVVAFCAAASLLVGLVFGIAPAWQATSFSQREMMARDSRTSGTGGGRLRNLLVIGQVAVAVLLLFEAGLLLRTLRTLDQVERGYRADRVLTMMVDPLAQRYPTQQSLQQFFDAVDQEVRALPGVANVAWATTLPMGPSDAGRYFFEVEGSPPHDDRTRPTADYQIVSASYFQTLDLPIVAGRAFSGHDTRDSPPVCIVNEAFVRGHLQGRSPLGTRIAVRPTRAPAPPVLREIVGVARQVKGRPDETEDLVQVYIPHAQNLVDDIYLIVRPTSGRAEALAPSVRTAISRVDRDQLVSVRDVMTLDDIRWDATGRHRFRAVMVTAFTGLALLLAMVGVFGILAYAVQHQGRELALRMALGAKLSDVIGIVLSRAAGLVAAGAIIGLSLATVMGRLLTSVLFGVRPLDPLTFVFVMIVLILTATAAAAAPAWRAIRIDPAVALRTE